MLEAKKPEISDTTDTGNTAASDATASNATDSSNSTSGNASKSDDEIAAKDVNESEEETLKKKRIEELKSYHTGLPDCKPPPKGNL